jgi:hypothetical protein
LDRGERHAFSAAEAEEAGFHERLRIVASLG